MYYYIVNPAAGKGAITGLQDKLKDRLKVLGIDGEFAKTTGQGDATKMTKQAIEKGHNTIVVVGGDGTVNEVVNGITKEQVAVGIIPIGNSNRLAHRFGINGWQQACEVLAARRLTSYGLIAAGNKYFLSTLTLGFETDLEKQIETAPSSGLGSRVRQFAQGWGHANQFSALSATITVDEQYQLEAPLFSMSVTNLKFDNPLAPNQLVVTMLDQPNRRQTASALWSMLKKHQVEDGVSRFAAKRIVVETDPPTGIMIDGQLAGRTPIAIRLTTKQIRFITEKQFSTFKHD